MTRMVSPDRACIEVDIGKRRYRGTVLDVASPRDAALLRDAGYIDAGPGGRSAGRGFDCPTCGFASWFTTCSRCGSHTAREEPAPST